MYYYKRTEPQLWTVGHDDAQGRWHPDSDHDNRDSATRRTAYLNGDRTAEIIVKLEARLAALELELKQLKGEHHA